MRGRRAADQHGVVPRRLRPLREDVAHARRDDADAAPRRACAASGSRSASVPSTGPGADVARRHGAGRGDQGPARAARAAPGSSATARNGESCNLTGAVLNDYIREHMGEEFTAKDFRTWGGTLTAAIALAEHGASETEAEAKRVVARVMRTVGERLGNTPAVARSSYVSPAVVEQYLDGRTLEDFRPRHLRVVKARDIGLDQEETRARRVCCVRGESSVRARQREFLRMFALRSSCCIPVSRGGILWLARPCSSPTCRGVEIAEGKGATMRITFHDARKGVRELDVHRRRGREMGGRQVGAARPAAEVGDAVRRQRRQTPLFAVFSLLSDGGRRQGPRTTMGRWGSRLVVGPAKAGKVARLLEGYLAELDRDPVLIVPNRSDVERVERDLLRRCGRPARRLDRHVRRRLSGARASARRTRGRSRATRSGRSLARRVARAHAAERPRSLRALRRLRGLARSPRSGSSSRACSSPRDLDGDLARLYALLPRGARPARPLGPRPAPPARGRAAPLASSVPGTAGRSSPTASRT